MKSVIAPVVAEQAKPSRAELNVSNLAMFSVAADRAADRVEADSLPTCASRSVPEAHPQRKPDILSGQ